MTEWIIRIVGGVVLLLGLLFYFKIIGKRFIKFIVFLVLSFALLYVGGWEIVWGENILAFELGKEIVNLFGSEFISLVFQVNQEYYGIISTDRFFYSPFLSWVTLGASLAFFYWALSSLGSEDSCYEEE
jgi:hypothetical protein